MKIKAKKLNRGIQLEFAGSQFIKPNAEFGGSLLTSHPKTPRPLSTKLPIHVTLRARRSVLRLPRTHGLVTKELHRVAKKFGVRIYKVANVGNHIHLLIRLGKMGNWAPFIRELTGRIAQGIANLGLKVKSFWSNRPHTRILSGWGRAYRVVREYIELNKLEAEGFITRREMKNTTDLRDFINLVQGTS